MTTAPPLRIGDLFSPPPGQWGFRGDPGLWSALQGWLQDELLPPSEAALWAILSDAYQQTTGFALRDTPTFRVKSLATGGLSSGMISAAFWSQTAFPLIVLRYTKVMNQTAFGPDQS